MTGKSLEVVRALNRRKVDICCTQETRWKGAGTCMIEAKDELEKEFKYKFFW